MGRVTRDGYIVDPTRENFFGLVHQLLPMSSGARDSQDAVGIDGGSDFLVERQAVLADSLEVTFKFLVASGLVEDGEQFASMFGNGQFPRVLPSPLVVPRGSVFTMQVNDRQTVAADARIRVLHIGKKLFPQAATPRRRYTTVRPYTLTANFMSSGVNQSSPIAAAGGQSQASVSVSSEWDFEVRKLVIVSDGPFTAQFSTSGKALGWFSTNVHSSLLGGTAIEGGVYPSGCWPFVLTVPEIVPYGHAIQVSVSDLSASIRYPNRIKIGFLGNRLYPPAGLSMM